jgi:sugar phosphate isomerase/epimerase
MRSAGAGGLNCVQFNMSCAGLPSMPAEIDGELCERIRAALAARGIEMAAVSGTFNMIHPDAERQADGLRRLEVLAAACAGMGTSIITLSTGTRDPDNMWRRHPDNDLPEAWDDLVQSLSAALRTAERHSVTLAFEPEVSNVIDSARKARRLLDEMASPRLRVVLDGANLFHRGELSHMREILAEACDLLGGEIALAHAKDLARDGEAGDLPAGRGLLDYDHYLRRLESAGYRGPLILHGLDESQVDESVQFLRRKLALQAASPHAAASSKKGE